MLWTAQAIVSLAVAGFVVVHALSYRRLSKRLTREERALGARVAELQRRAGRAPLSADTA